jgi:hypothetical protein
MVRVGAAPQSDARLSSGIGSATVVRARPVTLARISSFELAANCNMTAFCFLHQRKNVQLFEEKVIRMFEGGSVFDP